MYDMSDSEFDAVAIDLEVDWGEREKECLHRLSLPALLRAAAIDSTTVKLSIRGEHRRMAGVYCSPTPLFDENGALIPGCAKRLIEPMMAKLVRDSAPYFRADAALADGTPVMEIEGGRYTLRPLTVAVPIEDMEWLRHRKLSTDLLVATGFSADGFPQAGLLVHGGEPHAPRLVAVPPILDSLPQVDHDITDALRRGCESGRKMQAASAAAI